MRPIHLNNKILHVKQETKDGILHPKWSTHTEFRRNKFCKIKKSAIHFIKDCKRFHEPFFS